jgi:hypothetical protein
MIILKNSCNGNACPREWFFLYLRHTLYKAVTFCKMSLWPPSCISIMKTTWWTFRSIDWESSASICFEHYLLILRRRYTNRIGILNARNIPSAVGVAPPEYEQVMLETCRGPWFSINWTKMSSRWFHYTADTIPRRLEPLPKLYTCLWRWAKRKPETCKAEVNR